MRDTGYRVAPNGGTGHIQDGDFGSFHARKGKCQLVLAGLLQVRQDHLRTRG